MLTPDLTAVFQKTVIVKDGKLEFTHKGRPYSWTADFLPKLNGKSVLVNTAGEVFRGEKKLGNAR